MKYKRKSLGYLIKFFLVMVCFFGPAFLFRGDYETMAIFYLVLFGFASLVTEFLMELLHHYFISHVRRFSLLDAVVGIELVVRDYGKVKKFFAKLFIWLYLDVKVKYDEYGEFTEKTRNTLVETLIEKFPEFKDFKQS